MKPTRMTEAEKAEFLRHMRMPVIGCLALLAMLACIVILGAWLPVRWTWMIESAIGACMVVTVLLFSMDVADEPPLHRFYACLGFFWVAILMCITIIDYLTR